MSPFLERNLARALTLALMLGETIIRRTARDGRRVFFDAAQMPWTAAIESHWREVRAELDGVLVDRDRIPTFQEVSRHQESITNDQGWKTFVLFVYGTAIERNCRRCPRTAGLLRGIPGLRNAMFSILAPGKHIPEHRGPYNGLLRYHLALKVPSDAARCVLTVNGEERLWVEGGTLVFDDSYSHSVRNDTAEDRVVLFADFVRPLPQPLALMNRGLLAALGRSTLFREPLAAFERGEL
jgi:ornithine lipid ester-linked acyl 2-hydroxylase